MLRTHFCILLNILIEQAVLAQNKVAETVQEGDENSEPPSDFGSEPSSPPESDSEPESDPPEDDETPPESEFDDEPSTEPNSFMDESFIDSIIDDSIIEGSFFNDDDGTFYCLCIAFRKHTTRLNAYRVYLFYAYRQFDLAKYEYWHHATLYGRGWRRRWPASGLRK